MSLVTIGINHKSAPVEVRERVSFAEDAVPETLDSLLALPGIEEASLLSTCNRTEITCWYNDSDSEILLPNWLSAHHQMQYSDLHPYLYNHQGPDAVRHILRVACGLDSLVLGEPQILGQLKASYQCALGANSIGRNLNKLYQTTFATAKKIRTETEIGSSAVSVAFAAVSLAKQIFGDLDNSTALLIGAGETIELATRHLHGQGIGKILIANRTLEKATELAAQFNGESLKLENIPEYLPRADIVVSSTAAPIPILGKGAVERALKQRKHKPMFMVDIAVPRDIEPEVNQLEDVYLYTVDDLQDVIEDNLKTRREAADQAEDLVNLQVHQFMSWLQSQNHMQVVRDYRSQAIKVQEQVTTQAQKLLSQGKDANEVLQFLSHTLTNKLLHDATSSLNQAAHDGDNELLMAARKLFKLDQNKDQKTS